MSRQLEQDMENLLIFFGEDPKITKPEDLFMTISTFALALQVSRHPQILEKLVAENVIHQRLHWMMF